MTEIKFKMEGDSDTISDKQIFFDPVTPLEIVYERISVLADIEAEEMVDGQKVKVPRKREILKECSGKFSPGTFTAILGPSGCGKTTMMNLLSGRMLSDNIQTYGKMLINGTETTEVASYSELFGYVMQEDSLFATFTPRQQFKFVADMRLPDKTEQEKIQIVEKTISSLGLGKCADTYVGDALIRGISGGEKKRTSIGLELLINPSVIYLDEPTTGLDSTTALNLINFLVRLAKTGRTIVATIHQPSSEIFLSFDKILLMVDGNIIYNGDAIASTSYFNKIGLSVPVQTNPTDHYMKLMNKEGIILKYIEQGRPYTEQQVVTKFQERLQLLKSHYNSHNKISLQPTVTNTIAPSSGNTLSQPWCSQFGLLFKRALHHEFRNPSDALAKIVQSVVFGIIGVILYNLPSSNEASIIQNFLGLVFYIAISICFNFIFGSLITFNGERAIFIRQRLSNTYVTSSYFFARSFAVQFLQVLTPPIFLVIFYFAVPLNQSVQAFFWTLLAMVLGGWMSSSYGLVLSVLFKDASVAMSLIPVIIIPLLLVSGFFTPLSNVNDFYRIFEALSMFKYTFQGVIYGQLNNVSGPISLGEKSITITVDQFKLQESMWLNFFLLGIIGLVLKLIALLGMYIISNPKKSVLLPFTSKPDHVEPKSFTKSVKIEPIQ